MTEETPKLLRSFAGLRSALFDELDALRAGNSDTTRVRAVVQVAGRINDTVHAEMKVRKALGDHAGNIETIKALVAS